MTSWLTDAEIEAIQDMPRNTPYLMRGVSHGQLSIARYYGGCTFNGERYTYIPPTDELVRDDVVKRVQKLRNPKRKSKPKEPQ